MKRSAQSGSEIDFKRGHGKELRARQSLPLPPGLGQDFPSSWRESKDSNARVEYALHPDLRPGNIHEGDSERDGLPPERPANSVRARSQGPRAPVEPEPRREEWVRTHVRGRTRSQNQIGCYLGLGDGGTHCGRNTRRSRQERQPGREGKEKSREGRPGTVNVCSLRRVRPHTPKALWSR